MNSRTIRRIAAATSTALALTGCGGGGGTSAAFIPSPPVTPAPTPKPNPAATVTIFANPTAMEYSSVGVSTSLGETESSRYGSLSTADVDQPHIRYSSAGYYEIQLPGRAWDTLVPYRGLSNPTTDNTSFQPASDGQNGAGFNTVTARWAGYSYSEYASWFSRQTGQSGWVAFGIPTLAGAVPTTGSATFQGDVHGTADIMTTDPLSSPAYNPSWVGGNVTLNFNFAAGSLSGSMSLSLPDGLQPLPLGTWAFKDTVYSVGSPTYSGRFDTAVNGSNFFLGRFTGPKAQETIGAWAVPFVFSASGEFAKADNQTHQAIGAWVAKQP